MFVNGSLREKEREISLTFCKSELSDYIINSESYGRGVDFNARSNLSRLQPAERR